MCDEAIKEEGTGKITRQLIRLDDLQVIGERRLTAALGDRMAAGELVFRFRTLTLLQAGRYEFRLFADGRTLGAKSFNVIEEV